MNVCVSVLASLIRYAKRIFYGVVLFCVFGLSGYTMFFTLSQKRRGFRKKIVECKMYVFVFCTTFV